MQHAIRFSIFLSILLCAAIFGFFYAWVCSTMWGLDATDPRVAMTAMQAMNASVRNFVFFPAFFLTPFALGLAALLLFRNAERRPGLYFAGAALIYLCFGLILTLVVNVPMNEALGRLEVPTDIEAARTIWQDYSPRWQVWNLLRTIASGAALMLAVYGLTLRGQRAI